MSGDQDLLERATRALREATPPSQDDLAAARARLLSAHRAASKSQRARSLRWVLPLAAMLAAGTALAATPEALERVARAVSSLFGADTTQLASKKKRTLPTAQRAESDVAQAPAVEQAAVPTPEPVPVAEPASASRPSLAPDAQADSSRDSPSSARRARHVPRVARPERVEQAAAEPARESAEPAPVVSPPAAPEADGDLALYRKAHQAHFRARDFAAALRGWNAYLTEFPRGTFAVEARYNRAICLVRLGQKDEARRALTPFASGEVAHGYRQVEAKKLLEALE